MGKCKICEVVSSESEEIIEGENVNLEIIRCLICREEMIVTREHRPNFTNEERKVIIDTFLGKVDWRMMGKKDHANCHIKG